MSSPQIQNLRELQANINAAIDAYIEKDKGSQDEQLQFRPPGVEILEAASRIADVFKNPVQDLLELGFQVSLLPTASAENIPLIIRALKILQYVSGLTWTCSISSKKMLLSMSSWKRPVQTNYSSVSSGHLN
jgi:hypothetical protein